MGGTPMTTHENTPAEAVKTGMAGWMVLTIVVTAPLPLGAARPWSAALLGTLLGIALLFWAAARLRDAAPPRIGLRRLAWPAGLYGIAVLWGLWQTLPWVPQAWMHPLWPEAAAVLGPLHGTVSITPLAGRDAVMQLLAYATTFFLVLQHGRDSSYAWRLIAAIAVTSALYAAYGIANVIGGWEMIGPLDKWAYRGLVTGTLVNPNHFATLSGFGLLCCLALLQRDSMPPQQPALGRRIFWLCLIAILILALLLTQSRAGMFSTACGILLLLSIIAWRRHNRALAWMLIASLAICASGLLLVDSSQTATWLASANHRFEVFQLTVVLTAERPLLGTGLGSFQDAFSAIRAVGMVPNWNAAHNTYLELALELGIPATLALLAAQGWLVWRCLHGMLRRRRHWLICAVACAASLQLALHSLLDFSAQIPAVAVCWAALLGIGVAQSWSSRRKLSQPELEAETSAA